MRRGWVVSLEAVRIKTFALEARHLCKIATSRLTTSLHQAAEECCDKGISPIMIAIDGRVVTVIGISDPLKNDAHEKQ